MSTDYAVVAFRADQPMAKNQLFYTLGNDLLKNSRQQVVPNLAQMKIDQIQYVEILRLQPSSSMIRKMQKEIETKMAEAQKKGTEDIVVSGSFRVVSNEEWADFLHDSPSLPEEYQGYDIVYFLNELAVQMCRDGNVELEILKSTKVEELPENCSRCLVGLYFPNAAQK